MNTPEKYYIQEHKHNKSLVSEQNPNEHNFLLSLLHYLQIPHSVI
jgi:hypothetical protein